MKRKDSNIKICIKMIKKLKKISKGGRNNNFQPMINKFMMNF